MQKAKCQKSGWKETIELFTDGINSWLEKWHTARARAISHESTFLY
jgi:hypothetical protein